jgi:hypothetical protein
MIRSSPLLCTFEACVVGLTSKKWHRPANVVDARIDRIGIVVRPINRLCHLSESLACCDLHFEGCNLKGGGFFLFNYIGKRYDSFITRYFAPSRPALFD